MLINLTKELNFASGKKKLSIDTSIVAGSFVAISGPSGSGKTTLLRLIAGLSDADAGRIKVQNKCWLDTQKKINLSPQKRNIGFVFQNYALFPNMTVVENLKFALEKKQSTAIIEELLDIMELSALAKKYPQQLSGGQQQRTALARALVRQPAVLLLDEPLSALDEAMRQHLQDYILKIHQKYKLTTLMVSHDRKEIDKMANRVLRLKEGQLIPTNTISSPSSEWQLAGTIVNIIPHRNHYIIELEIGSKIVPVKKSKTDIKDLKIGEQVTVLFNANQPIILPDQ